MNRLQQSALRQEMKNADASTYETGTKIEMPRFANVRYIRKEQTQRSFSTEEELQTFLVENQQYVINQRFGLYTKYINVEFYEHGYAETKRNAYGGLTPLRWLSDEEVAEYLAFTNK